MATVRFSDDLKTAIINNAKAMFNPRLTKLEESPPDIGTAVATLVMEEFMPHIVAVNSLFFRWHERIEIVSIGSKRYGRTFKLARPFPAPGDWVDCNDGSQVDSNYNMQVKLPDTDRYAPFKQQLDEWQASIKAVCDQRDEFVAGVKKVIEAHATLAPALKAWPPLWDLVPEEYKERHRKVVERSKASEVKLDVDLTKLTSTVVATKLVK